ncbi:GNAT family N-acetyltransferase [Lederbergia wuyishanensis]|uniref:Ribosomal protein S18 acetylase RimI-like enzyme n=1 Tax=Lederbergia wuyishanensis TaxID=1347903 RepID=A0ABU0D8D6_9BACI|nr:GNAT family N-acetyltransferase [Lederbergia wuyishanensis]MCJ8009187.1 GNAT family N-acetyltransferase [Lederbergia wuyishanensis]MDQ0344684.1 ribosomal protein S18 acetylase RimI-like enzyme [Lederbergia wuyishanensis]
MLKIRNIKESEIEFLKDMMYESIHIPENKPPKEELLNLPHLKKYNENWGRAGDRALLAEDSDGNPLGAAWYRLFNEQNKGYGYVDSFTPELGIAVSPEARGMGIGSLLMKALIERAKDDGFKGLSLSVDPHNEQAVHVYKKLGFEECGLSGTSVTMVYDFAE